ncbi:MAG TPA: hypothetical protein VFP34_06930 [Microlunatus sp.]|nr:hypothetical protein [Microlunatus sp.]
MGNNRFAATVIGNDGDEFSVCSTADYMGICANGRHRWVYDVTTCDAEGQPLEASSTGWEAP